MRVLSTLLVFLLVLPVSLPVSALVHVGTCGIDRRQAEVVVDRIRPSGGAVANVDAVRGRKRQRNLDRWVRHHGVPPDDVALRACRDDDPVRVAGDLVVLDQVVVRPRAREADAKVAALGCESVPARPVPTEPVVAAATGQSYAATGSGRISVPDGNVLLEIVFGGRNRQENPRRAVAVRRDALDRDARRRSQTNPVLPESLHDPGPENGLVGQRVDVNPDFAGPVAGARRLQIRQACHGEAIELQRQAGCTKRDTRRAGDGARDVADQLTVVEECKGARNGAADVGRLCRMREAHRQQAHGDGDSTSGVHDQPPRLG